MQEEVLSTRWTRPIQKPLGGDLDSYIAEFLEECGFPDLRITPDCTDDNTGRHVSAYEKMMFTVTGGDKNDNDSDAGELIHPLA